MDSLRFFLETLSIYLTVVIVGICTLLVIKILLKKEPYLFEIILMKAGVNKHISISSKELNFKHKIGEIEYEIKTDSVYRVKPSRKQRIYFWMRGIQAKFWIMFKEGTIEPIKSKKPNVSSQLLFTVQQSKALDKALHEEFKVQMDVKKMLLLFGFGIVIFVIYLVLTGKVK